MKIISILLILFFFTGCDQKMSSESKKNSQFWGGIETALSDVQNNNSVSVELAGHFHGYLVLSSPYSLYGDEDELVTFFGKDLTQKLSDISYNSGAFYAFLIVDGDLAFYKKWVKSTVVFDGYIVEEISELDRSIYFDISNNILLDVNAQK